LRLIVGLGNPGVRYAATRHNVGWRVLERAAARWKIRLEAPGPARLPARWGRGRLGEAEVELAEPLAWMNETGPAVQALLEARTLTPSDLIVVHDDLDLEPGRLRIKRAGGAGGHNGIHSIISALETNEFCRLKIGIGRPAPGEEAEDYVLMPFAPEEEEVLEQVLEQAVLALETLACEGVGAAMNRFNVRPREKEEAGEGPNGEQE
jgi:PTH1 family peptidyl-tRNA hydrolase